MPDKYEREIEEILRKASFSGRSGRARQPQPGISSWLRATWQRYAATWTPTRLMVVGIAIAFLGYFLRAIVPPLAGPVTLVALVLLIGGLVMSVTGKGQGRTTGWRGRTIDLSPNYDNAWAYVVRRWRAWRRGWKWRDPH